MTRTVTGAACTVFLIGALFSYVRLPNGNDLYLRVGDLAIAVLTVMATVTLAQGFQVRDATVLSIAAAVVTGVIVAYALLWPVFGDPAAGDPSLRLAVAAGFYCCAAIAFARFFYDETLFLDAFHRVTLVAVLAAVGAFGLNVATGSRWLVHLQYGTPRLQGFLSEPSAWAPFLSALLLLSAQRRRYAVVVIAAVAIVLTKSPTVVAVLVVSAPVYALLTTRHPVRRITIAAAGLGGGLGGWWWLKGVDVEQKPTSTAYDQIVVRLAGGLENVTSGGTVGRNDRFAITSSVFQQLDTHGWLAFGIGPGSEGYLRDATGSIPNSLATYMLASFGVTGLLVLVVLAARAMFRLRHSATLAVFLPFVIASFVNSAGGWESYKFVVVGVAASWSMRRIPAPSRDPLPSRVVCGGKST